VIWIFLGALLVAGIVLHPRLGGVGRAALWSAIGMVGSYPFRGGRVLAVLFAYVLLLVVTYWLALPRDAAGRSRRAG
jgi:hypothetical protein